MGCMRYLFLLSCLMITSLSGKPLDVKVSGAAAILMNADTGAILYEKNAHTPGFPASTTKVASVLYILDHLKPDLNQQVTVSAEALRHKSAKPSREEPAHWLEWDGTMMGVLKGEVLTLESLLHGIMLRSGNDASNVAAEALCGSIPTFVAGLNNYVESLGCKNTHFQNPHGLHHPEHVSTPYDMALIMKRALSINAFRNLVKAVDYQHGKTNKQPLREFKSNNPLIKPKHRYYYDKAIGGKTGFTSAAKNTLIAAATHEGRTLIVVIYGCERSEDRFQDAKRLFEAAFAEKKERHRFLGPENRFTKVVPGSDQIIKATLTKGLEVEYFPSEEPLCKAYVHWKNLTPPIQKGDRVGSVEIVDATGLVLQQGDLIALEEVRGSWIQSIKAFFSSRS
jgi:serine-type D-Ala-D-Ala carboxypeptidase (penicillin-binding protein 5/6)